MSSVHSEERLQAAIADITRLLEKHRVLTTLAHRQEGPRRDLLENLQHRQNLAELHKRLRLMHSADVAFVLEALPHEDRRTVWEQLAPERAGQVLVEVPDTVRESLLAITPEADLTRLLPTWRSAWS
jgi:magnesium transporter